MSGGLEAIEIIVNTGVTQIIGDNTVIALIVLGIFSAFVMLQNTRLDHKVPILLGAGLLAVSISATLRYLLLFGGAIIVFWATMKILNK